MSQFDNNLNTPEQVEAYVLAEAAQDAETPEPEAKAKPEKPKFELLDVAEKVEKPEPEVEDEKREARSAVQRRIDELTRAKHEALREAEFYRRRAEEREDRTDKPAREPKQDANKPPVQDDYPSYDAYMDAKVDYQINLGISAYESKREQHFAQTAAQQNQEKMVAAWTEKETELVKRIPDYTDVMSAQEAKDLPVSPAMVQALHESDHGPEIAYYLAKNPELTHSISEMSPLSAARAIGKIEAQLTRDAVSSTEVITPPVSRAPTPLKPIRAAATSGSLKYRDDMTQSEYRAWKRSQSS